MSHDAASGFLALHRADTTFVLPNAWDPGSACSPGRGSRRSGRPVPGSPSGSLARAALTVVHHAAEQLREGRFDVACDAIPYGELNALMEG